jgi:hypothetical protein
MEPANQGVDDHSPSIEEYERALPNLIGKFNYLPAKKFQFILPEGGTITIDEASSATIMARKALKKN